MNAPLVQRALWLAGITLIAALVALAITRRDAGGNRNLPRAIAVPGTKNGYYTAKAAPYGPTAGHRRTACGKPFLATTEGVAHPVLPCGVRLYMGERRWNGAPQQHHPHQPEFDQFQSPGPARHPDDPVALRQIAARLRVADPVRGLRIQCRTNKDAKGACVR